MKEIDLHTPLQFIKGIGKNRSKILNEEFGLKNCYDTDTTYTSSLFISYFKEFDDFIILRSDGSPTYNFCAAVDDMEMKITTVIRGDDHITNTLKQINVLDALEGSNFSLTVTVNSKGLPSPYEKTSAAFVDAPASCFVNLLETTSTSTKSESATKVVPVVALNPVPVTFA